MTHLRKMPWTSLAAAHPTLAVLLMRGLITGSLVVGGLAACGETAEHASRGGHVAVPEPEENPATYAPDAADERRSSRQRAASAHPAEPEPTDQDTADTHIPDTTPDGSLGSSNVPPVDISPTPDAPPPVDITAGADDPHAAIDVSADDPLAEIDMGADDPHAEIDIDAEQPPVGVTAPGQGTPDDVSAEVTAPSALPITQEFRGTATVEVKPLDVIFLVDTSGSMREEKELLEANMAKFSQRFAEQYDTAEHRIINFGKNFNFPDLDAGLVDHIPCQISSHDALLVFMDYYDDADCSRSQPDPSDLHTAYAQTPVNITVSPETTSEQIMLSWSGGSPTATAWLGLYELGTTKPIKSLTRITMPTSPALRAMTPPDLDPDQLYILWAIQSRDQPIGRSEPFRVQASGVVTDLGSDPAAQKTADLLAQGALATTPAKSVIRSETHKAIVVVSDDNARAKDGKASDFLAFLETQPELKSQISVHGLIGLPGAKAATTAAQPKVNVPAEFAAQVTTGLVFGEIEAQAPTCRIANDGLEYVTLSEATGGTVHDICSTDWNALFNSLATDIIKKIRVTTFHLDHPADPGRPLKVIVGGKRLSRHQLSVSGTRLEIEATAAPDEGDTVTVEYYRADP